MKVLQCHNRYQMHGGEDGVVADERRLLESRGHSVVPFELHNDDVAELSKPRLAAGTIWSRSSAGKLRSLCRSERPDVAHFHNTVPLMSPSSYYAVRGEGVPVVQTLHNYRLLCPKATFFRDGKLCEKCLGKRVPWPAVRHACYRDDRAASATLTAMLTVHRSYGTYRNRVDAYICCSDFTRQKMIAGGLPVDRLHVKPNFVFDDPGPGSGAGGYVLYLGRLSREKGVSVLAEAWRQLQDVPLEVIGRGPEQDTIDRLIDEGHPVRRHHWVEDDRLRELMAGAAVLVLPSVNYEGFPRVIVEAYSHGLPVIATGIGAMAEVVEDRCTGRHFRYADPTDLARVVRETLGNPRPLQQMREAARRAFVERYTDETNYRQLMSIYQAAAERRARPPRVAEADPASISVAG